MKQRYTYLTNTAFTTQAFSKENQTMCTLKRRTYIHTYVCTYILTDLFRFVCLVFAPNQRSDTTCAFTVHFFLAKRLRFYINKLSSNSNNRQSKQQQRSSTHSPNNQFFTNLPTLNNKPRFPNHRLQPRFRTRPLKHQLHRRRRMLIYLSNLRPHLSKSVWRISMSLRHWLQTKFERYFMHRY